MKPTKLWTVSVMILVAATACTSTTGASDAGESAADEPTQADVATDVAPTDPPPTDPPPTEPEPTAVPPTDEPAPAVSGETEVVVIDSSYRLKVINVTVGTTVTWVYDAGLPHTVTADDGSFESGTMGEGDTFTFTFDESGVFPYFCRFHGSRGGTGMSGVVNVVEG